MEKCSCKCTILSAFGVVLCWRHVEETSRHLSIVFNWLFEYNFRTVLNTFIYQLVCNVVNDLRGVDNCLGSTTIEEVFQDFSGRFWVGKWIISSMGWFVPPTGKLAETFFDCCSSQAILHHPFEVIIQFPTQNIQLNPWKTSLIVVLSKRFSTNPLRKLFYF